MLVRIGLGLQMLAMPLLLLIAAVSSLLRNPKMKLLYMLFVLVTTAFVLLITVIMVVQMANVTPANLRTEPGLMRKLVFATVILDIGLLAYPVFLLIWFRRASIRRELTSHPGAGDVPTE